MATRTVDGNGGGGTAPYQPMQSTAVGSAAPGYNSMGVPAGAFDRGASGLIQGGAQLDKFSDQLEHLVLKQKDEDNEAAAREADVGVSRAISAVTWGADGKSGYFSAKGKDALENYSAAEEAVNKSIAEAMKSAPNDTVQRMLSRSLESRRQSVLEQMNSHAARERSNYMDGLNEARVSSAQSDAALAFNDPSKLSTALGIIATEWENRAGRTGIGSVEPPKEGEQPSEAYVRMRADQSKAVHGAFDAALAAEDFGRAKSIMTDPGVAKYLDGTTSAIMEKRIRIEQVAADSRRKQAEDQYQSDLKDGMFNKMVAGKLTTSDIMNSGLKGQSKYQFMQMLERTVTDPQDVSHPVLFNDLTRRVYAPEGNPSRIVDENSINDYIHRGELSAKEGMSLRRQVQELRKPDDAEEKKYGATAAKAWGTYIKMGHDVLVKTNAMGMTDPDGAVSFYSWQAEQRMKWDAAVASGKDALDLLNPNSKDYIGTPVAKSPQQIMKEQADRMRAAPGITADKGAVPEDKIRKPGESIDDYMKRTGMKP